MKSNKFFIAVLLSVILLSGISFETYADGWRDYLSSVSTGLSDMTDWASRWATAFVNTLSEHRKKALLGALLVALGIQYYSFSEKQKEERYRKCEGMKKIVEEYNQEDNSSDTQERYTIVNDFLKDQRKRFVNWFDIACLYDEEYANRPNAYQDSLNFLRGIRDKFPDWKKDIDLSVAIRLLEKELAKNTVVYNI